MNADNTKCIKCPGDYQQPNSEGNCVIDYCEEYDEEGNCEKCEKYFYKNENGECQYIDNIPFCRKIKNGECDDWAGFLGDDDSNDLEEAKREHYLGCERKDENGVCYFCDSGYILDEETHTCNLNCEEFEEPSHICEYCEHGYILLNEKTEYTSCYPLSGNPNDETEDGTKDDSKAESTENSFKFILFRSLCLLFGLILLI